jgi:hypothetical protein
VWLDGDAGKYWRISTKMAQTQGGTPHDTLRMDHYIFALDDAGGNLGGFRWLGEIRQPSYIAPPTGSKTLIAPTANTFTDSSGNVWSFGSAAEANGNYIAYKNGVSTGGAGIELIQDGINNNIYIYNAQGVWFTYRGGSYLVQLPPTDLNWRAFSGVTWRVGGGSPTPLVWPYTSQAFTATVPAASTTAANNYYTGTPGDHNVVPVYVTGGNLPAPLSPGQIYFAVVNSDPHAVTFDWNPSGSGESAITLTGPGSGTIVPVPIVMPFQRLPFATADGMMSFFKGTGSISAETRLRATIDQAYWVSTGLIPPYDLAQRTKISDTTYAYNWTPVSIGDLAQAQSGGGDHPELGPIPNDGAIEFFKQSKAALKLTRIIGFAQGLQPFDFRDFITDAPANLNNITYTGLPPPENLQWGYAAPAGFNPPPQAAQAAMGFDATSSEHRPGYSVWAYFRTGELQFLDRLVEAGNSGVLMWPLGDRNPSGSYPYPVAGVVTAWRDEYRSMGWANTWLQVAALLYPYDPNNPTALSFDGTQEGKYLNDLADANIAFPVGQLAAGATIYGAQNAYIQSRGLWTPFQAGTGYQRDGPEWQNAIILNGYCYAAARGNAKAKAWLSTMATRWSYIINTFGGWHLYHYYERIGTQEANAVYPNHVGRSMIGDDAHYVISISGAGPTITWAAGSPGTFTLNSLPGNGWAPGNGDTFIPYSLRGGASAGDFPPEMDNNTPYYVVNYRYPTFNLATSPGGRGITISGRGTLISDYRAKNPPANNFPSFGSDYALQIRLIAYWAAKLGATGMRSVQTDTDYRLNNTPGASVLNQGARYVVH